VSFHVLQWARIPLALRPQASAISSRKGIGDAARITNHSLGHPPENFAPIERKTIEHSDGEILANPLLLYGHTASESRPVYGKTAAKSSRTV